MTVAWIVLISCGLGVITYFTKLCRTGLFIREQAWLIIDIVVVIICLIYIY